MALSAGEQYGRGGVIDQYGRTVVISETTNAALSAGEQFSGGMLKDADGRIVICQDTLNSALVAGEQLSGGFVRDSIGRLVVAVDAVNTPIGAGEQYSGGGLRDSQGRIVVVIDALGSVPSAGEAFTGGQLADSQGRIVIATEGGSGPFNPNTIGSGTPIGWWKADALVLTDGTAVASWPDSSGAGLTMAQATGAKQPIFNAAQINGLPAVTFSSAAVQQLNAAAITLPASFTLFAVARATVTGTQQMFGADPGGGTNRLWQFRYVTGSINVVVFTGGSTIFTGTQTTALNTFQVLTGVNNGGVNVQARVNQVAGSLVSETGVVNTGTIAPALGAQSGSGAGAFNGQIAEMLAFSGALNITDIGTVESYLKSKYGL